MNKFQRVINSTTALIFGPFKTETAFPQIGQKKEKKKITADKICIIIIHNVNIIRPLPKIDSTAEFIDQMHRVRLVQRVQINGA